MRLSTRYGLIGIGALALLTLAHHARALERPHHPSGDYLLGVLPNFAAAIAIAFVLLGIWTDQNREADFASAKRPFLVSASMSGLRLLAWELLQRTSGRLFFDPHHVGATFVGVGAATMLFYSTKPRRRKER
jgi:hypothetical protein